MAAAAEEERGEKKRVTWVGRWWDVGRKGNRGTAEQEQEQEQE